MTCAAAIQRWELPSPEAGTDSDNPTKDTGEMCLIAHSAVECNLRKSVRRAQHGGLRSADALPCDVGEGSLAEAHPEHAGEVTGAESHDAGEVSNPEPRVNIGLDVAGHAFNLPGGEAAAQGERLFPRVSLSILADLQQLCRPLYASFGRVAVAVEGGDCRRKKLDKRFVA